MVDRIEEDFGGQSSGQGVGVVPIVIRVVLVGLDRELVDIGFADRSDDMPDIEIVFDEILLEVREEFRDTRRVPGADVIDGFDESFAEHIAPHAVDETLGEIRIFFAGYPGGKLGASRGVFAWGVVGHKRELRCNGLLRLLVFDFAVLFVEDFFPKGFCTFDSRTADGVVSGSFVFLQANLGKVSCRFVVLVLGPTFEGVVVAFVAVEANG